MSMLSGMDSRCFPITILLAMVLHPCSYNSQSQSVIETPVKGGIHATYRTKIHINKVKVFTAGT